MLNTAEGDRKQTWKTINSLLGTKAKENDFPITLQWNHRTID